MQRIVELANVSQGLARSGRAAGARAGDWNVRIAESGDVRDGWLKLDRLKEIGVLHNNRTERHLLRPFDVLVTARAGSVQSALVPPAVSRTVASVTRCWWSGLRSRNQGWGTTFGIFSRRHLAGRRSGSG